MIKNSESEPFPKGGIHDSFVKCARQYPQEPAVILGKHILTYRELDHRSSQLACYLRRTGMLKGNAPVGIALGRSLDLPIAILGVLKGGGAYLPLDPDYPRERLEFLVQDSGMALMLSHSKYLAPLSHLDTSCMFLDSEWEKISREPVDGPAVTVEGDHPAYVIYTSGSTGQPKGVCCHHKGVMNLLMDFQNRQPIGPGDRGSWWTSFNFDVSVYEIFAPLTLGGALVMVPESVRADPPAFMDWLFSEGVTSAYLPPMMVADLESWIGNNPGQSPLRRLLVGVEPLSEVLLNAIDTQVPDLTIINGYGPTEATVCATLYTVGPENSLHENVPIGKSVCHMQVYLLDPQGQPVGDGEIGEVWIGGAGVAHGYLNRPDLTSQRFQPNPFSKDPTDRVYRTGDMARHLPDGNFMFVGREDFQVKFHGYRIELGEIEEVLRRYVDVREGAVLLREDKPGIKQLVAYVVCKIKQSIPVKELSAFLKKNLPEYMQPSLYVFLDSMPVTPNGKTDRRALLPPDLNAAGGQQNSDYEAPASDTEKALTAIFENALGMEALGVHDNFFELGGHSLMAARVCSAILKDLNLAISPTDFFKGPTIRDIALKVSKPHGHISSNETESIPSMQANRLNFPASFAQKGIWMLHHMDPKGIVFNIPLVVDIKGPLAPALLKDAFDFMVQRYEILRTSFVMSDHELIQKIHPHTPWDMPVEELSHLPESQRIAQLNRISAATGSAPLDLSRPPLMKTVLVRMGPGDFRLVFCIHHSLIDGWGAGVFFRELSDVYEALAGGQTLLDSPPPFQYGDVVLWQQQKLLQDEAKSRIAYWTRQLKGPRWPLNLLNARPRPRLSTFKGERLSIAFSQETTLQLKKMAREENVTLFMVMLGALKALLFSYSGETDMIVGATTANRNHLQLEKVIGVFINSLAMRTNLSGDPSFKELLKRVRHTALGAYDHQDIPFEQVMESLNAGGDASRDPIFRVLLILQNTPLPHLAFRDMVWSYEEVGNQTAKVDILLNLEEKENCLVGWFEYNRDLFDKNSFKQMAQDLKQISEKVLLNPNIPLSDFRNQILSRLKKESPTGTKEKFSCIILGEGTLPRVCGEILLKKGCTLHGVISPDEENRRWAEERGIAGCLVPSNLEDLLKGRSFDYLFSIVNSCVLTPEVLALPRRYTINYHDGPLPRYAGMHATAWAIMNGEKKHGITWHKAAAGVDTGDILQQQMVSLDANETSLTLNGKCYGAAVSSFESLVDAILEDKAMPSPQDLDQRTYYGLYQKPPAGGLIVWTHPAEKIHARVRALDFGQYDNPLGLPKLWINHSLFIVGETRLLGTCSGKSPGTVVAVDDASLVVATGDGDLAVGSFKTMDGALLKIAPWARSLEVVPGNRLPLLDPTRMAAFETCYAEITRHESFWVKKMSVLRPLRLPWENLEDANTCTMKAVVLPQIVPGALSVPGAGDAGENVGDLAAAIVVYLSRICQTMEFDVGFRHYGMSRCVEEMDDAFAPYVPLAVKVDGNRAFSYFNKRFQQEIHQVLKGQTFSTDLPLRYLALAGSGSGQKECPYGVALEIVETFIGYQAASGPSIVFVVSRDQTECRLFYDPGVLSDAGVKDLARHFNIFMTGLEAFPESTLVSLPLLTDAEYRQQVVAWNDTKMEFPENSFVHQRFEVQAREMPDAIALVHGNEKITYRDLNARANRLARYLQKQGVGREVLVGVFMKRSIHVIIAMLGILKAGGAYVPLDPAYPADRISLMCRDSGIDMVLTMDALKSALGAFNVRMVLLDEDPDMSEKESCENLHYSTRAEDLAYVIYTSGSTGIPKGVMVEHGGVANHAMAVSSRFGITPHDGVAQFFSISFDGAVEEIFMALTQGASLVMLPFDPLPSMKVFMEWVEQEAITVLDLPSAFWHEWMHWVSDNQAPLLPASLRAVIIGGEKASDSAFATWVKHTWGQVRFFNTYGPTETTVVSTLLEPDTTGSGDSLAGLSIGLPIANTQIYVVDGTFQALPVGIPGEMLIGGAGVARGYLNHPELTRKKFIPDTFHKKGRLYRTGDRVQYRPDGQIDFLGRLDSQVKIRGFRVEPGEVESALLKHPAVGQAAVSVQMDARGENRLAGYLVYRNDMACDSSDVMDFLRQTLPPYLVPAVLMPLASLPRLPNGKIDRRSLPAPDRMTSAGSDLPVPPGTPFEKEVAVLWKRVLGISNIGIHDNFFELGGHSLLAVRLCSEMETHLGKQVPLQMLFQTPTIQKLCESMNGGQKKTGQSLRSLVEIQEGGEKPPLDKEFLLSAQIGLPDYMPEIRPFPRYRNLPLSSTQLRLWYIKQLSPDSIEYNLPFSIRLTGSLDIDLLRQSLHHIINRHEALRTRFDVEQDIPVQVIADTLEINMPLQDYSSTEDDKKEEKLDTYLTRCAKESFDLFESPLVRASIIKLSNDEHVLFFMTHHIVFDGISFDIFHRELFEVYESYKSNLTPQLPELCVQYADYAVWQQEWLHSEAYHQQLAYWLEQLKGELPLLQMPLDRPRPAVMSFKGSQEEIQIPIELVESLSKFGHTQGATLFMVFLAAFRTLLYKYTKQKEVFIGIPFANRVCLELNDIIGFFANTIVCKSIIHSASSFKEVLTETQKFTLDALGHQGIPFERLVEKLNPVRDLSMTPLYQAMFIFVPEIDRNRRLTDISWQTQDVFISSTQTDLCLCVDTNKTILSLLMEYNTDLFYPSTIKRILNNFKTLLTEIVKDSEESISGFSLISELEKQKMTQWNMTDVDIPKKSCLHHLIERQASKTPHAIAASFENKQITFEDLNTRTNKIANFLHGFNIGPDTFVGICMERSLEMLLCLVGVLKAGGAYLPLDPDYPEERLAYMMESAKAPVLLTQKSLRDRVSETNAKTICFDSEWEKISRCSSKKYETIKRSNPKDLAYVIFTSGSTGKPKGVQVPHSSVVNFLTSMAAKPGFTSDDTILAVTTLSFDIAVLELFLPLITGGKTVIVSKETSSDGQLLFSKLQSSNATVMQATPSTWRLLITAGWKGNNNLRILCGGEAFPLDLAKELVKYSENVWNMYGPTETTVWSTCFQLKSPVEKILIGHPIANTQTYILDDHMSPVPVGVSGGLFIGGEGLTRGYLNRPDLTSSVFIENPFSDDPDSKLYKTGDLARYDEDGNIEYLDRFDNQVKVRGFRIELGEIESVLAEHETVKQGAVIVKKGDHNDERLVAYLIPDSNYKSNDIRSFLNTKLPNYMIPQFFIEMTVFPLTQAGKIDRKLLRSLDVDIRDPLKKTIAPRTIFEQKVIQIWQEVLGIEKISIGDNFFEIGGHSLLAVIIVSKLAKKIKVNIPLASFLRAPTAGELANLVEEYATEGKSRKYNLRLKDLPFPGVHKDEEKNEKWTYLVPIQPEGSKKPLFCMHAIGGNVLNYFQFASKLGKDQPLYGLQARGLDGRSKPFESIELMAKHYNKEILRVQPNGPYNLCGGSMGGIIAFEMAHQLKKQGHDIANLIMFDTHNPIYIASQRKEPRGTVSKKCMHSLKLKLKKYGKGIERKKILLYLHKRYKLLVCYCYLPLKYPIPQRFRYSYLVQKHYKSLSKYRAKKYNGNLILFYNDSHQIEDENHIVKGWKEYIEGDVTGIGLTARHSEFIENPSLAIQLAEILKNG